jgi:sulfonate transport system permease protein
MWKKIIFILGLMLIWQALAHLGFYNQILLPPPLDIGKAFMTLISSGSLLIDVVMSLKRMLAGFVMAVVLGLTLAILLVLSRPVANYVGMLLELIRPIPPIAWIPIAILWFGIGDKPAYFIVTLGSFFPIFVNCFAGIRQVDPKFILIAKSFSVNKR